MERPQQTDLVLWPRPLSSAHMAFVHFCFLDEAWRDGGPEDCAAAGAFQEVKNVMHVCDWLVCC